jgi:hypothetical protein
MLDNFYGWWIEYEDEQTHDMAPVTDSFNLVNLSVSRNKIKGKFHRSDFMTGEQGSRFATEIDGARRSALILALRLSR